MQVYAGSPGRGTSTRTALLWWKLPDRLLQGGHVEGGVQASASVPPSGRVLTYRSDGSETRRQTVTSTFAVPPPSRGTLTRTALLWWKLPGTAQHRTCRGGCSGSATFPPSGTRADVQQRWVGNTTPDRYVDVRGSRALGAPAGRPHLPVTVESASAATRNPTIHFPAEGLTRQRLLPPRCWVRGGPWTRPEGRRSHDCALGPPRAFSGSSFWAGG